MICNQTEPMILQVAIFHYARCGVGISHAAFLREREEHHYYFFRLMLFWPALECNFASMMPSMGSGSNNCKCHSVHFFQGQITWTTNQETFFSKWKKRSKFLLTMNGNNRVAKILIEKVSRLEEASSRPKSRKKQ